MVTEKEIIEAQATTIAEKLNDLPGLGFYCKAIRKLGVYRCFELLSLTLLAKREGRINSTPAKYFNGCVKEEIRKNNYEW